MESSFGNWVKEILTVGAGGKKRLGQLLAGLDQLALSNHMGVQVVDRHVEAQRLQQDVLIRDKFGGLLRVLIGSNVQCGLVEVQANVGNLINKTLPIKQPPFIQLSQVIVTVCARFNDWGKIVKSRLLHLFMGGKCS